MEHVVFFPAHDGSPAFRRLPSLEEAVRLVEHLRNVEGIAEVSVHALAEVPLSFKAWYRVEVPATETAPAPAAAPEASPEASPEPTPEPAAELPAALPVVPEQSGADAEPERVPALAASPSSLGFFAS